MKLETDLDRKVGQPHLLLLYCLIRALDLLPKDMNRLLQFLGDFPRQLYETADLD